MASSGALVVGHSAAERAMQYNPWHSWLLARSFLYLPHFYYFLSLTGSSRRGGAGSAPPPMPAAPPATSEKVRLWIQALSPILQAAALLIGVRYAAKNFRIGAQKHQAEWYANFRDMHCDFWQDPRMAIVRKWIANPNAYRDELVPVLERRAISPDLVSAVEYDALETVDRFCALLSRILEHNPEALSADHVWMIESTFDIYWINTVMADRPGLHTYMKAHWPRLMQQIEQQRAARAKRPVKPVAA